VTLAYLGFELSKNFAPKPARNCSPWNRSVSQLATNGLISKCSAGPFLGSEATRLIEPKAGIGSSRTAKFPSERVTSANRNFNRRTLHRRQVLF